MAGIFGIGVRFTFDSRQAEKAMKRTDRAFRALGMSAKKSAKSLAPLARSLKVGAAVGAAVFAATAAKAVSVAANFEQQMSAVAAVSQASATDMKRLSAEAKRLGATTSFSAIQAAQGQELLARAGFSTEQIMGALPGVMAAAAAEGMDLATASDIVASAIKGFGKDASEAGKVADILALASAKSNTSIIGLGEGIKMSVAQMSTMGISLEDTAAALGILADAGLKGSLGGTALTNMFVKLTKPSKVAARQMKAWGFSLTDAQGKTKRMGDIVKELGPRLMSIEDAGERAALMTEIFGIRGAKAMAALMKRGGDSVNEFAGALENSTGAASRMAEKRLDNLKGAFTLFKSALEGMFIETGSVALRPLTEGIRAATKFLSDMVVVLQGNDKAMKNVSMRARRFAGAIQAALNFVTQLTSAFKANWPAMMDIIGPALDKLSATFAALFPDKLAADTDSTTAAFLVLASVITMVIETIDKAIKAGVFLWETFKSIGVVIGWVTFQTYSLAVAIGEGLAGAWTWLTSTINTAKAAVVGFISGAARKLGSIMETIAGKIASVVAKLMAIKTAFASVIQGISDFVNSTVVQGALSIFSKLSNLRLPGLSGGGGSVSPSGGAPPVRAPASANIREVGAANVGKRAAPVRVELGGADSSVQKVVIENRLMLDGRQISHNLAKQEVNLKERSGARLTPGQRRETLELGRLNA